MPPADELQPRAAMSAADATARPIGPAATRTLVVPRFRTPAPLGQLAFYLSPVVLAGRRAAAFRCTDALSYQLHGLPRTYLGAPGWRTRTEAATLKP
jgi:hypothetical protein